MYIYKNCNAFNCFITFRTISLPKALYTNERITPNQNRQNSSQHNGRQSAADHHLPPGASFNDENKQSFSNRFHHLLCPDLRFHFSIPGSGYNAYHYVHNETEKTPGDIINKPCAKTGPVAGSNF